jgi:3-hydroxyisobutyrate dehydrogenase-like beta-hydroxyacid dehydrogenase
MATLRVGLVGTGRMGTAMGERILAAKFPLTVHNRTAERAKPLLDSGASWAQSPAELADASDIVLTVLTDDAAVQTVYQGAGGLLTSVAGKVLVECSTVRTATITRLHPAVRAAGARLVDAPLAGPPAARSGRLLILAGGDPADLALIARCSPPTPAGSPTWARSAPARP